MKTANLLKATKAMTHLTEVIEKLIRSEEVRTGLRFNVCRDATPGRLPVNFNTTRISTKVEGFTIQR